MIDKVLFCTLILGVSLFSMTGCKAEEKQPAPLPTADIQEQEAALPKQEEETVLQEVDIVREAARKIAREICHPGMEDTEKIQAAYEWVISSTTFAQPVGLDIWRYRGQTQQPNYLENRSLSPLLFGIGSCEDYAAALTVLLQEMGFEAMYVAGLTISVEGDFVDHAWTAVCLRGEWYHLDSQLEDNILKNNLLTYRYFLCSDDVMLADHRWGKNLLGLYSWTEKQQEEILKYAPPECVREGLRPPPKKIEQKLVNRAYIEAEIAKEQRAYEAQNGPLPPLELHTTPPVFGGKEFRL